MADQIQKGELKVIKLSDIRENPDALREVNRTSEAYVGLVDSIRKVGVLKPINVREIPDRDNPNQMVYGLIDGLHRFTAAQDAGLEEIPAYVLAMNDAEVLEAQLMANVHKVETRPAEYSNQLLRILGANPTLTINELSKRLAKSPKWLQDRLSITKLDPKIQVLVDEGKINLTNAYALAKLKDFNEQENFLERSMTEAPAVFVGLVTNRVKEISTEKRKGRDAAPERYIPVAHLRKPKEIQEEIDVGNVAASMKGAGKITNLADFTAGLKWAVHLDDESVEQGRIKWEKEKKDKEEKRKKMLQEKNQKKIEEARKALEGLNTGGNGARTSAEEPVPANA